MLQRIRIRTTRLSKLYNDADHNFYLSHSVSLWWSIMILCLLTDSALGSQRHLNSTSVTLSIPSDGIRHKVPNHHHHTYCHSIFSPFKLPPSAKWMPKVKLHQVDNKIILSPVIFQGRMISRSNMYNSMYFANIRVQGAALKGDIPRKARRSVRLLFHTDSRWRLSELSHHHQARCRPVPFSIRPGKKYIFYVKKVSAGRYVPVAIPNKSNKRVKKLIKKLTCTNCAGPPKVASWPKAMTVTENQSLKLKCKFKSQIGAVVEWDKNGRLIKPDFRLRIKTKKRRSVLKLSDIGRSDSGTYSCRVRNILGESEQTTRISVRYSAPEVPPSECPIKSFCLNGGFCMYYEMIGELVCRCSEGFVGQRCQFKKAMLNLPDFEEEACGPYGHEIHLQEICAAWKRPPETEMTKEQFHEWQLVEHQLEDIRRAKELEQMEFFRKIGS